MSDGRSEPLPNTCASMAAVERIPRKHDIMEENSGFQWATIRPEPGDNSNFSLHRRGASLEVVGFIVFLFIIPS